MGAIAVSVGDQIASPNGEIPAPTSIQQNQWAISPNGLYVLIMQADGNLVLYQVDGAPPAPNSSFQGYPIWASQTDYDVPFVFDVQTDGNLVIYNGSNPIWASNTQNPSPAYLAVQDDGNVVYYDNSGAPFWASNSAVYMPGIVPTLPNGDTGRFDFYNVAAWHSMNNDGDNGAVPTVSVSSNTLTIAGGFQWDHYDLGSGEGTIKIEVSLTPATCSVSAVITGRPFPDINQSGSGSWQLTSGDKPILTCNLDDGSILTISTFDGGGSWYPGVEINYSGGSGSYSWQLCFENMSSASAFVGAAQGARHSPLRETEPAARAS